MAEYYEDLPERSEVFRLTDNSQTDIELENETETENVHNLSVSTEHFYQTLDPLKIPQNHPRICVDNAMSFFQFIPDLLLSVLGIVCLAIFEDIWHSFIYGMIGISLLYSISVMLAIFLRKALIFSLIVGTLVILYFIFSQIIFFLKGDAGKSIIKDYYKIWCLVWIIHKYIWLFLSIFYLIFRWRFVKSTMSQSFTIRRTIIQHNGLPEL